MTEHPSGIRRVAIVTGGSSGIGKATVRELALAGFNVAFTFHSNRRSADELAAEVSALGAEVSFDQLDLADTDRVGRVMNVLANHIGNPDVLINNAAIDLRDDQFVQANLSDWRRVLDVNFLGAIAAAKAVSAMMIERGRGGRLINVTSVVDSLPVRGAAAYSGSKAALEIASRCLALELSAHGIIVNTVAPGHTHTPQNFGPDEIDPREGNYPEIPLGRPAEAAEIARLIVYLASAAPSYLTGARYLIDGGLSLVSGPEQLEAVVDYRPSYQEEDAASD
jgi:NAD(P)-dependent dehydrogenase (short-subunit alcohol dehydrogenase family)